MVSDGQCRQVESLTEHVYPRDSSVHQPGSQAGVPCTTVFCILKPHLPIASASFKGVSRCHDVLYTTGTDEMEQQPTEPVHTVLH